MWECFKGQEGVNFFGTMSCSKVGAFLWIALQNRILTSDRLHMLGIANRFPCVLSGKVLEDTNHLLLNCAFSQEYWKWVVQKLGWFGPFPSSFIHMLIGWPLLDKGSFAKIWRIVPSAVVWCLWWEIGCKIWG